MAAAMVATASVLFRMRPTPLHECASVGAETQVRPNASRAASFRSNPWRKPVPATVFFERSAGAAGNLVDATGVFCSQAVSADKMRVPESHPFPNPQQRALRNDPHGCPCYADHVADCGRPDSADAAASQLHRRDLPDPERADRARPVALAAHVGPDSARAALRAPVQNGVRRKFGKTSRGLM